MSRLKARNSSAIASIALARIIWPAGNIFRWEGRALGNDDDRSPCRRKKEAQRGMMWRRIAGPITGATAARSKIKGFGGSGLQHGEINSSAFKSSGLRAAR